VKIVASDASLFVVCGGDATGELDAGEDGAPTGVPDTSTKCG
jgi:hypothetical protein